MQKRRKMFEKKCEKIEYDMNRIIMNRNLCSNDVFFVYSNSPFETYNNNNSSSSNGYEWCSAWKSKKIKRKTYSDGEKLQKIGILTNDKNYVWGCARWLAGIGVKLMFRYEMKNQLEWEKCTRLLQSQSQVQNIVCIENILIGLSQKVKRIINGVRRVWIFISHSNGGKGWQLACIWRESFHWQSKFQQE